MKKQLNRRNNLNGAPKSNRLIFQVAFGILIVGFIIFSSSYHDSRRQNLNRNIQARFTKISPENIKSVNVRLARCGEDTPVTLDRHECEELAKYISRLAPTSNTGLRGDFQIYRAIDIDAGSVEKFCITLMTRNILRGRALASVQVVGEPVSYSSDYDGEELWNWLKKIPIVAQQDISSCKSN